MMLDDASCSLPIPAAGEELRLGARFDGPAARTNVVQAVITEAAGFDPMAGQNFLDHRDSATLTGPLPGSPSGAM